MFHKNKKDIYIFGAGGLGKEVYNLFLKESNEFNFKGYLDSNLTEHDPAKNVFSLEKIVRYMNNSAVVMAIGDPMLKHKLRNLLPGFVGWPEFPSLVHKNALVGDATIGRGTIIFPNVTLTANNVIGNFCTIYQNCSISHDTVVGNFCNITPGVDIAGRCTIGDYVYLGIGCVISNDIKICNNVKIGAGAVVVDNITESGTYVGVPAKKI